MRQYVATPEGKSLAIETGLEDLAVRLFDTADNRPQYLVDHLAQPDYRLSQADLDMLAAAPGIARPSLKSEAELALFEKGMSIDKTSPPWRIITDVEHDGLFPGRSVQHLTIADNDYDKLVVSGVAGLDLTRYRGQCPLLARSRFENFGFKTFNEACAFVGGYVIGRQAELHLGEIEEITTSGPSFSHVKDGLERSMHLGGSFHGDFRMAETLVASNTYLSPINTMTLFGALEGRLVTGYHSIEPEIIATIIESEFIRNGDEGIHEILDLFRTKILEIAGGDGKIGHIRGNFGDYGHGNSRRALASVSWLVENEEYRSRLKQRKVLHQSPSAPQSSSVFKISLTDSGLRFTNRIGRDTETECSIDLEREHYGQFFQIMLRQTMQGLGRTSPHQLIDMVAHAIKIVHK